MQHLTGTFLTRYLAGELSSEEMAAWQAHVRVCEECSRELIQYQQMWNLLGAWDEKPPVRDLRAEILDRLDAEACQPLPAVSRFRWSRLMRVAASLAIAVGAGYAAARWQLVRSQTVPQVCEADLMKDMGVDMLASSPMGLYELLIDPQGHEQKTGEPS